MKKVHFIAMGGAAMHNLALALNEKEGYRITGSDDEFFDPSKSRLAAAHLLPEEEGWHAERITEDLDAVIVGMHAREDNPELVRAKELGIKIYSFPEYLYEQTKDKTRVVIGGSHGKTTTTAMILFVLKELGIKADYMVGAQIEGFQNMVGLSHEAKIAVFEGDEYLTSPLDLRSKFLLYHPHIALLTGIAWDHINVFPTFDSYVETFRKFVQSIEPNGRFIWYAQDENLRLLADGVRSDVQSIPYDTPKFEIANGKTTIEVNGLRTTLGVFGEHNLQNIMGAYNVCRSLGITDEDFFRSIARFTGAANRLENYGDKLLGILQRLCPFAVETESHRQSGPSAVSGQASGCVHGTSYLLLSDESVPASIQRSDGWCGQGVRLLQSRGSEAQASGGHLSGRRESGIWRTCRSILRLEAVAARAARFAYRREHGIIANDVGQL